MGIFWLVNGCLVDLGLQSIGPWQCGHSHDSFVRHYSFTRILLELDAFSIGLQNLVGMVTKWNGQDIEDLSMFWLNSLQLNSGSREPLLVSVL